MGTPLLLLLGLLPLFVGPNWAASNAASQTSLQSASSGETTAVANSNPTVSLFTFVSAGLTFGEPANAFADYIPNSHLDVDHHALWQPWSSAMSVSMNASTTSSNDGSVGIGSEMITSPLVGPINDETSKRLSRKSRSLYLANSLHLTSSFGFTLLISLIAGLQPLSRPSPLTTPSKMPLRRWTPGGRSRTSTVSEPTTRTTRTAQRMGS